MAGLKWRGREVQAEIVEKLGPALADIGLVVEAEAKQQLYKGHGVLTGTLRRSIHCDSPSHSFAGDPAGPELGGKSAAPEMDGSRLMIAVGSGLGYAMPVHQGHRSFGGYHFITLGAEKARPRVPGVLRKHLG